MDPDAALERWRAGDPDAQEDLKDPRLAREALRRREYDKAQEYWRLWHEAIEELLKQEWLRRGGFEPRWDAKTKKRFWASVAKAKKDRQ